MRLVLLSTLLLGVAACASTGPRAADRFEAFDGQTRDFTGYDRVYLAPLAASEDVQALVNARVRPGRRTDPITPIRQEDLDQKLADLREDIVRDLSQVVTLVDEPGPGTLTIAVTLTKIEPNRPTMEALSQEVALSFNSTYIGDAGVVATLSEGGEELAVIGDEAFRPQINDPGVGVGIWYTADRFFDRFGDRLADLLA